MGTFLAAAVAASLVATLSPPSQYVQLAQPATFLETVTNTTNAPVLSCAPTAPTGLELADFTQTAFVGNFSYTAYSPSTGQFLAPTNQPFPIQPHETVAFLIDMVPLTVQFGGNLPITVACANGVQTPTAENINTMFFGAYPYNPPDVIMSTSQGPATLTLAQTTYTTFSVSAVNVGFGESLVFYGSTSLPLQLGLCQTNAAGECILGYWGGSTYVSMDTGAPATFTVFARPLVALPAGTVADIKIFAEDTTGYDYGEVGVNVIVGAE